MYNVAIIDDDNTAIKIIKNELESFFDKKIIRSKIYEFTSPINFLATIKETYYDLIFLDIDMPEKNGIDVGKELNKCCSNINIIFISSREDLVFDCFVIHPFGFIRKTKFKQDFQSVIEQFYTSTLSVNDSQDKIEFIKKNNISSYKINEIVYIEGLRNYQQLHLKDDTKDLIRISMNKLETKLSENGFIRVQKGF